MKLDFWHLQFIGHFAYFCIGNVGTYLYIGLAILLRNYTNFDAEKF